MRVVSWKTTIWASFCCCIFVPLHTRSKLLYCDMSRNHSLAFRWHKNRLPNKKKNQKNQPTNQDYLEWLFCVKFLFSQILFGRAYSADLKRNSLNCNRIFRAKRYFFLFPLNWTAVVSVNDQLNAPCGDSSGRFKLLSTATSKKRFFA